MLRLSESLLLRQRLRRRLVSILLPILMQIPWPYKLLIYCVPFMNKPESLSGKLTRSHKSLPAWFIQGKSLVLCFEGLYRVYASQEIQEHGMIRG